MATSWELYNNFKTKVATGAIDLSGTGTSFSMVLANSASNAADATLASYGSLTGEVSAGTGYVTGGNALVVNWSVASSADVFAWSFNTVTWNATVAPITNVKYAIIRTNTSSVLCCWSELTTGEFSIPAGSMLDVYPNTNVFDLSTTPGGPDPNFSPSYAIWYLGTDVASLSCNAVVGYYNENPISDPYAACITTPSSKNALGVRVDMSAAATNLTYTELATQGVWPYSLNTGDVIYMAAFIYYDGTAGNVFDNPPGGTSSFSKHLEFYMGGTNGWIVCPGNHECLTANVPSGYFSVTAVTRDYANIDPANLCVDHFMPNYGGYSTTNPPLMTYDQWNSIVLEVKITDQADGYCKLWVNGTQVMYHSGFRTTADATPALSYMRLWGTVKQPQYNSQNHHEYVDGYLMTTNWADIVNGGYLLDVRGI